MLGFHIGKMNRRERYFDWMRQRAKKGRLKAAL
jgi:hypothetical protein